MKTKMTELFGIKYPIMQAGMNWVTQPKIVSAVCNAGGIGFMAIARCTPEETRQEIKKIRDLTDKPFGVNINLMSPTARGNVQIAIEQKVPVINYSIGKPWFVKEVHAYRGKVIGTVTTVRHAISAEKLGVDAINATGYEAGGHPGWVTSMVLIPLIINNVKIPVVAAGGFYDGRGLVAALALGASGINMGTRFAVTKESSLHDHWKQIILKSNESDTLYQDHLDMPRRVLKTKKAEAQQKARFPLFDAIPGILELRRTLHLSYWQLIRTGFVKGKEEDAIGTLAKIRFAADYGMQRKVTIEGDEKAGAQSGGQIVGGINDIPNCQELINRIMSEAEVIMGSILETFKA